MAATLGVLPSDFTYAGIKDKRAVTYQSMVVKKVSPQRYCSVASTNQETNGTSFCVGCFICNCFFSPSRLKEKVAEFEKRGMRLSQIRSVNEPLKLGRLRGNHFDLVVRKLRPHGASDGHLSGADGDTRLAALVKEAVENVKVF